MNPHPVDIHVGKRLRARRTLVGMSQEELGHSVGITFQQVQKYERGLNRIGSSRLYQFSCLLGVGVEYFFEDFAATQSVFTESDPIPALEKVQFNNKEVLLLVRSYYGISDVRVRKKILSLVKSLSTVNLVEEEESKLAVLS